MRNNAFAETVENWLRRVGKNEIIHLVWLTNYNDHSEATKFLLYEGGMRVNVFVIQYSANIPPLYPLINWSNL